MGGMQDFVGMVILIHSMLFFLCEKLRLDSDSTGGPFGSLSVWDAVCLGSPSVDSSEPGPPLLVPSGLL